MENLEYPFSDKIFLHCGGMFNFMDYVYYPKFDTNCIVSEKVAHAYENDTPQYNDKCQYVINCKDNFLMIDGSVDDYVIYYDLLLNRIINISINDYSDVRFIYENDKLVRLDSYLNKREGYLNGFCIFKYIDNQISEEQWFDVSEENTKEELNRKVIYEYNPDKKIANKKVYNSDNNLIREIMYTYLVDRQLIKDIFHFTAKRSISTIYVYDYSYKLLSKRLVSSELTDSIEYKEQNNILQIIERTYKSGKPFDNHVVFTKRQVDMTW